MKFPVADEHFEEPTNTFYYSKAWGVVPKLNTALPSLIAVRVRFFNEILPLSKSRAIFTKSFRASGMVNG